MKKDRSRKTHHGSQLRTELMAYLVTLLDLIIVTFPSLLLWDLNRGRSEVGFLAIMGLILTWTLPVAWLAGTEGLKEEAID